MILNLTNLVLKSVGHDVHVLKATIEIACRNEGFELFIIGAKSKFIVEVPNSNKKG